MVAVGLGLKAATITPPQTGDVGSPNRILREGVGGSVIVRTGRRIPGVVPLAPVVHPIVVVRMAVGDAYGADEGRTGTRRRVRRAGMADRADRPVGVPLGGRVLVPGGGGPRCLRVRRARSGRSRRSTRGCSRRRWTQRRHAIPRSPTGPMLIDAAYAGPADRGRRPVPGDPRPQSGRRLPVRPGAGHVRFDRRCRIGAAGPRRRSAARRWPWPRRPTGRRPRSQGKNVANPMAMLLACAAALDHAPMAGDGSVAAAAPAIRDATLRRGGRRDPHLRPRWWRVDQRGRRRGDPADPGAAGDSLG